jgi:uncharacterized protein YqhQ
MKVGGQAFGDGVLMRSKNYWALVRENGSTEFGSTTSWLDHHPRWNVFLVRSVVAFMEMAKFGLKTGGNNSAVYGKRFLAWMAAYVAVTLPASYLLSHIVGTNIFASILSQFFYLLMAILATGKGMSGEIWMYHGAEHKAVNAFENDCDLNDIKAVQGYSRVHQRCGTNLVFLILIASAVYMPNPGSGISVMFLGLHGLYLIFAMAIMLELFRQLTRWPQHIITKIFLLGGNMLQRFATTKEPNDNQVAIASKALQMVLALEGLDGNE